MTPAHETNLPLATFPEVGPNPTLMTPAAK